MDTNSIDLESYFQFLDLLEYNSTRPKPDVATLTKIVEKHATNISYQNIDLHSTIARGDLAVKEDLMNISLIQRKLIQKRSGMCYEINFLLEAALTALGFIVHFLPTFNPPYCPEREPSHPALLVQVESDYYVVDPGFGANGMRAPLKINFETAEETIVFGFERYQIVVEPMYYQVNFFVDEKLLNMFYFMRDISGPKLSDKEAILSLYVSYMTSKQEFKSRDLILCIGGPTPDGRFYNWYDKKDQTGFTFKQSNFLSTKEKIPFKDFGAFQEAAKDTFGIEVSAELQSIRTISDAKIATD